jgi:UDP-N-acetylmuramoyl-tripeptide--D-alanyl-D-alanine ligase
MKASMGDIAQTLGWQLHGTAVLFDGIATDTRKLLPGQLFVALEGENHDGHDYVIEALQCGAAGALVSREVEGAAPLLQVPDTLHALGQLAALHRAAFKGTLFAVTGSAGKTTTKEMLAAILRQAAPVLATSGNLNNEIGVPLTLFRLDARHRYAVIEMGAAKPGDIRYLVDIADPDISILTNARAAHLEGFGSLDQVARTKGEIFVDKPGRLAVINSDEPYSALWQQLAGAATVISYGTGDNSPASVRAINLELGAAGSRFDLVTGGQSQAIELPVPGHHNVANALAAAAAAIGAGIGLQEVAAGLANFNGVSGRMQFCRGAGGMLVIDDSYNANPDAVRSAIDVLAMQSGSRLLLLGDMAELGDDSLSYHREVGRYARAQGIEGLFGIGPLAAGAAEAFGSGAQCFADKAQLLAWLGHESLASYNACLVKGSRRSRMEQVVEVLLAEGPR